MTILVPQLILTLVIYLLMYLTFYPVQAFFAVIFYGPAGLITTWFTVLQQSGMVSAFIVTFLLMPEIQRVAFDAVLSKEYTQDVVLMGKLRRVVKVPFLVRCGQAIWALPNALILPFHLFKAVAMFVLSSIPVLGPILVVLIQAPSRGLRAHSRYFALKGYNQKQIKLIYKKNTGQYMGFGIVANFLESIPILSIFFMFTNTIGAAIWVIDIEQEIKIKESRLVTPEPEDVELETQSIETNEKPEPQDMLFTEQILNETSN